MKNGKYIFIALLTLLGLGCKESASTNDQLTGTLRGKVLLYNEQGTYSTNYSGVTVQIEGTPYSATTDSTGTWEIKNLPTRTCSISFSKPGYLTWKNTSFVFIGGGIMSYGQSFLYPKTNYEVTLDAIVLPKDYNYGNIFGHVTPKLLPGGYLRLVYLAGHRETMDITDSTSFSTQTEAYNYYTSWDTSGNFTVSIPYPGFNIGYPAPFELGDTMYVKAIPYMYLSQYYDIATDKTVTSGYGKSSNVLSGIVE